ncbi:uncharacterized protein BCR38DRAFT_412945 [Pseudomassariella vexata]|uniref:DUF6546 domain-containing protein n=1 Tax=Pseudomassariella vexata TaxID=1141098 RepID=A0A1Y2DJ52_9PEZI|nr:uncharacterized protein BCR38DRAFT_412945 [Pseudomassariella vexata]ORY59242.1 hypothetical protein BCR38DRAFT_412945 [Pseudomassariella vexata]
MTGWPLPPELTSLAFAHLDSLVACAAVCSQWQPLAERQTFSKLELAKPRVDEFERFTAGPRREFVTEINIVATRGVKGREADLTDSIRKLLKLLSLWNENDFNARGIKLVIDGLSPADLHQSRREVSGWRSREQYQFGSGISLVPAIKSLEILGLPSFQAWVPAFLSRLVTRLPGLEGFALRKVEWDVQDWGDFVKDFSAWPATLRDVKLAQVRIHFADGSDALGRSMHHLSRRLRSLEISGCTWTDIFMPRSLPYDGDSRKILQDEPDWPHLESLTIRYTDTTPTGKSLYTSDDLATRMFDRASLNDQLLSELYLTAGKAALRMPRLRYMQLGPMGWNSWTHLFVYEIDGRRATASWNASLRFQPPPEVLDAWKTVAWEHTGRELRVCVEVKQR